MPHTSRAEPKPQSTLSKGKRLLKRKTGVIKKTDTLKPNKREMIARLQKVINLQMAEINDLEQKMMAKILENYSTEEELRKIKKL